MESTDNLLTVQQYAELQGISKQAVYGQIQSGKVKVELIDGTKMIDPDKQTVAIKRQAEQSEETNELKTVVKQYKKLLKHQDKQSKELVKQAVKPLKQLVKRQDKQIDTLKEDLHLLQERYYALTVMMFQQGQKSIATSDEPFIDAKLKKDKKNKKSKRQKK